MADSAGASPEKRQRLEDLPPLPPPPTRSPWGELLGITCTTPTGTSWDDASNFLAAGVEVQQDVASPSGGWDALVIDPVEADEIEAEQWEDAALETDAPDAGLALAGQFSAEPQMRDSACQAEAFPARARVGRPRNDNALRSFLVGVLAGVEKPLLLTPAERCRRARECIRPRRSASLAPAGSVAEAEDSDAGTGALDAGSSGAGGRLALAGSSAKEDIADLQALMQGRAMGESCGLRPEGLQQLQCALACRAITEDRRTVGALMQSCITSANLHVQAICRTRKYDETPLRARVLCGDDVDSGIAKLFQVELGWSVLLQSGAKHLHVRGALHTCLNALENSTGETQHAALRNLCALPPAFKEARCHKYDVVVTDRAASNTKAEDLLDVELPEWTKIHVYCDVHRTHTCASKVLALAGPFVSGLVRMALSLSPLGMMPQVRTKLKEVLSDSVRVYRGSSSSDAERHRRAIIDTFLPEMHAKSRRARHIMNAVANGDWRVRGEVQHFCSPGCCRDRADTLRKFMSLVVPILTSTKMPLFPRHRWVGAEKSVAWVGLFESMHGLCSTVYFAVFPLVKKPPVEKPPETPLLMLQDACAGGSDAAAEDVDKDQGTVWRQEQETYRTSAREFLSDPNTVGMLCMQRRVLEPLRRLMQNLLQMSSDRWSNEQMAKGHRGQPREYRVLTAFEGKDTKFCLCDLAAQMFADDWLVPPEHMNRSSMTLVFRQLAIGSAMCVHLLARVHRNWPYALFAVLHGEESAREIFQECPPLCCAMLACLVRVHVVSYIMVAPRSCYF